jgi:HEAT repeat protein
MIGASEQADTLGAESNGVGLLARFLSDADPALRLEAARALGKLGPAAAVSVPGLTAALQQRNLKLRLAAATALGSIGAAAAPAIPALAAAMTGAHLVLARLAAQALSRIGRPAVDTLVELLESPDPYVRREAAWALSEIGPGVLKGSCSAPIPSVPTSGNEAETLPEGRHVKTPVIPLRKEEVIAEWRERTLRPPRSSPLPDPVTALSAALADVDPRVRAAAAQALQRIQVVRTG